MNRNDNVRAIPFLSTVNQKALNFDLEKVCSVSLSHLNVYCCLVCGKYLQGREPNSPAFSHSVNENHHIFVRFQTQRFYILPEGKIIKPVDYNEVLKTIRDNISPTYEPEAVRLFPVNCTDVSSHTYYNGFIPLYDSSHRDFANVVIVMLSHIPPIRDTFLVGMDTDKFDPLVKLFGLILRKHWSKNLLRAHVLTDELLSYISINYPRLLENKDPRVFLLSLLNALISKCPQLKQSFDCIKGRIDSQDIDDDGKITKRRLLPFTCLTLDLPEDSVFKSSSVDEAILQTNIEDLMKKYDGEQETLVGNTIKRYRIAELPDYLILHYHRFDPNSKQPVKNRKRAIVTFPTSIKILDVDFVLIENVVHKQETKNSPLKKIITDDYSSKWGIQLNNKSTGRWMEFYGNHIKQKDEEFLFLDETYIQLWKKQN